MESRRGFLKVSAAGLAAGLLAVRGEVDRAFAESQALPATADDYALDPAIAYLNHGSVGTVPRLVQTAHQAYLETCERNPAQYMWSEPWTGLREEVRGKLARFIGCAPAELAITHNTTEGFNVLAQGLSMGEGDEVLFSSLNHAGASLCFEHRAESQGFSVRRFEFPLDALAGLTADEVVDLHLREIRDETRMLVIPHVDNRIGLRTPVARLAAAARERGVEYVAVDGAQAVGMLPVDLAELQVDFYAASPHKWLQSPKGLGLLYVSASRLSELQPMWTTWGQGRWAGTARVFEDYGTRNLPALLALGDAVTFQGRSAWTDRERHLRTLWRHTRDRAEAHRQCSFASPTDWSLAASLYGIRYAGDLEAAATVLARSGVVVRVFPAGDGSLIRVSPNLANQLSDIDRFFDTLPG